MKIIFDRISTDPQHALSKSEVIIIHKILNTEFDLKAKIYRLCSELPEKSRFDRPVHYDIISRKLNICSRGLTKETIIREIFVEVIQNSYHNLAAAKFNRLSSAQRKQIDEMVNPLYAKYIQQIK